MSATWALFTRWLAAEGHPSPRQGLLALGLDPSNATHWKGGRNASADVIERMARDLGEEPALWTARAMQEQTQGEASRAWGRIAEGLQIRLLHIMSSVRRALTPRARPNDEAGPPH